jgi:hypothetical protein
LTRRPLGVESSATLARRTYTIMIEQRTIAAVTEWLPPGRLAAMTMASGKARAAAWQPFPRSDDGRPCLRSGFEFVADL